MKRAIWLALILICLVSMICGCGKTEYEHDNVPSIEETDVILPENVPETINDEEPPIEPPLEQKIEVIYPRGGAGIKDGGPPVFSGRYNSIEEDIHDLLEIDLDALTGLPVYRKIVQEKSDGTSVDDYENVIERLKDEAFEFLSGTGIEKGDYVDVNKALLENKQNPRFMFRHGGLRFNSSLTFFSYQKDIENAEGMNADNILEVMENNKYYAAAARYIGLADPEVAFRVSREYEDMDHSVFHIYQPSDDPVETIYNMTFKSIWFSTFGDGDVVAVIRKATSVEDIGTYAVRDIEKAAAEASSVYGIEKEDILAWDIGYYDIITPGYFIPCYRFIADTHGTFYFSVPGQTEPDPMECIDVIVPAVELG